jgi:hypothetical protein
MVEWNIKPVVGGTHRASVLTSSTTLDEILCRLRGGNPPPARCESGNAVGPLEGACRALWTITPRDQEAVDLFFNGRDGYRAAYSVGVSRGEQANSSAIEFFSSWLRDFTGVPVRDSPIPLLGAGAKLWVPSDERVNCALITGRLFTPEVLVAAWLHAAESGIVVSTTEGDRYKAAAGVLAPRATRLNVIGAWIRDGQVIDARVKERSNEIHLYGYT